ncbi:hypothetical protein DFJ73DRAFT_654423 [Zopfochytrium polystomum]|nr:hypothetical protein DFJ73DRAFT_654423 [Zopfochytrium polystomum]
MSDSSNATPHPTPSTRDDSSSDSGNAPPRSQSNDGDVDDDEDDTSDNGPTLWRHIQTGVKELINAATTPFRSYQLGARAPGSDSSGSCMLMGRAYPSAADPLFIEDFRSRLWMTYRNLYPPIQPSHFTSDVGWGCMLRSGQMMMANALVMHYLGRDWRLPKSSSANRKDWESYVKIVSWFFDSNSSPYSIHRIALLGKQFDKDIGQWFGPTTISQVLKILNDTNVESSIAVYVATDGCVILDEMQQACVHMDHNGKKSWRSLLVLVPVRLGLESLNSVYVDAIKRSFAIPHTVGVAGGRPNSSLYFIGYEGDNLVYLDPHYMRETVSMKDTASYSLDDLATYHCQSVRLVPVETIDPSMVFGFYCKDEKDFHDLNSNLSKLCIGKTPLFSLQGSAPNYTEAEVLSDSEEF